MITIKEEESITTVSGDIAQTDGRLFKEPEKRDPFKNKKKEKDNNMIIKENDQFKFYKEGERKIFEFKNHSDFENFQLGLKKANHRYWRLTEACISMLEMLQQHKGKEFVVRFQDKECSPYMTGII